LLEHGNWRADFRIRLGQSAAESKKAKISTNLGLLFGSVILLCAVFSLSELSEVGFNSAIF
jgi:hypothetical protein